MLQQVGDPTPLPQEVIPARDVLYHFCCDVFRLRDWIAATVATDKDGRRDVAALLDSEVIKTSPELAACRDIANGSKHLVLDGVSFITGKTEGHAEAIQHNIAIGPAPAPLTLVGHRPTVTVTRSDGTLEKTSNSDQPPPDDPAPVSSGGVSSGGYVRDTFIIDVGGEHRDAQEVAAKAVAAWDEWLQGDSRIAMRLRDS